jgi:hypothetical protein
MSTDEQPRRPLKVIVLVVAFWVVGSTVQSGIGWALDQVGLAGPNASLPIRQLLAWSLLFGLSYRYRADLDDWLRR